MNNFNPVKKRLLALFPSLISGPPSGSVASLRRDEAGRAAFTEGLRKSRTRSQGATNSRVNPTLPARTHANTHHVYDSTHPSVTPWTYKQWRYEPAVDGVK